jgi:Protein of unknown function (DUF4245)
MTDPPTGPAAGREPDATASHGVATPNDAASHMETRPDNAAPQGVATPDDGAPQAAAGPSAPVNTTALRLSRTPLDMAKAMLVLLVPVMIAVAVYVFFFGGSSPIVIDPSGSYGDARAAGVFPVVQPQGLASGWKSVSSTYGVENGRHVLRVGYLAPDGSGLQLLESDGPTAAVISDAVGTANPVGASVTIGGRTWGEVGAGKNDQQALINTGNGYTIIVKGQSSDKDLQTFAGALH